MNTALTAPLGVGAVHSGIAYYCDTIESFLKTEPRAILERLFAATPEGDRTFEQDGAWKNEITCLKARLNELHAIGYIVFEYNIIRMAKRIDVVLLLRNVVYSLEFKNGQNAYLAEDMDQALDYALRLKAFHKVSSTLYVCPVLIATNAGKSFPNANVLSEEKLIGLQKTNQNELGKILERIDRQYGSDEPFDFAKWFWSDYHPSPSIVEAAVDAFNSVKVADIAHSEAGQDGIDRCVASVEEVIRYAKENKAKCLCFVTGVPGAGKTLVGLDVAARNSNPSDDLYSVYISGNGPLVDVLCEALASSWLKAGKVKTINAGRTRASSLIQDGFEFRKACLSNPNPPPEKILIFDEAQRVWDADQVDAWTRKRNQVEPHASEPELTIRFMDRHEDWAVVICLVGLGQDIHVGESGIAGWIDAALASHQGWELFYSENLFTQKSEDQRLMNALSDFRGSHVMPGLHLGVSVRSFRAEKLSDFVNELVEGNGKNSSEIYKQFKDKYPVFVTRDFGLAKKWAEYHRVGSQRIGLVASSSAKDMYANGVNVQADRFFNWPRWFLSDDPSDNDCSNSLTFAASEFKIQGLEIDWSVVCWGADFRFQTDHFEKYVFQKQWKPVSEYRYRSVKPKDKSRWITNAYRVILTRARQGMVIYVPKGTESFWDKNYRGYYDSTYEFLTNDVGLPELKAESIPDLPLSKLLGGSTEMDICGKIRELQTLLSLGLISKEEFEDSRKRILERLIES